MEKPSLKSKDWITAGGVLGVAVLLARFTRIPLFSVIQVAPFLLRQLHEMETRRSQGTPSSLTRDEARLILGVSANATQVEINEAHKRLIQKNHPDLGGTDYLAAKINQARDILLK